MGTDKFLFNSKIQTLIGNNMRVEKIKATRREDADRSFPPRYPTGTLSHLLSYSFKPQLPSVHTGYMAPEVPGNQPLTPTSLVTRKCWKSTFIQ